MGRIGELDLPDRLARFAPAWVVELLFALLMTLAAIAVRAAVDSIAPSAGPFALGYPAVLIATLFGRWRAGLATVVMTILYQWYFTLPPAYTFDLATPADGPRIIVATATYAAMVMIAELFRQAVRRAAAERDRQIAERDLYLEEFDHRVRNNFALVASLLDMQRRRAGDPATGEALAAALSRVESIARAHRHLYRGTGSPGSIDMAAYLHELCAALSEALFLKGAITLSCESDPALIPRDRAVSLGLVLNELVTNAAKHAFAGRDSGAITVAFRAAGEGWRLTVADNGGGMPEAARPRGRDGGLGQRLVEAFVKQAGGTIATESGAEGTVVTVTVAG
ncbi:MAG: histidine kinase dimerization/phosphoacceptor domain -containing protein [Pseudomonadota bacterium]